MQRSSSIMSLSSSSAYQSDTQKSDKYSENSCPKHFFVPPPLLKFSLSLSIISHSSQSDFLVCFLLGLPSAMRVASSVFFLLGLWEVARSMVLSEMDMTSVLDLNFIYYFFILISSFIINFKDVMPRTILIFCQRTQSRRIFVDLMELIQLI